jgi:glucose-1-phosphate thymidylyltransferase
MDEVIGLIPAAGRATRIAPLPGSKELYPVALRGTGDAVRPKVVSHFVLERMRLAGVRRAYLVLREGKWDIPSYYNDGTALLDMHLAYLMMRVPYGAPFTLDQAYPFVRQARIALGFPDMVFEPAEAYARVLARQEETRAEVVLGLFPCDRPYSADMVECDPQGRVRQILIKQNVTHLRYTWVVAVWTPAFTQLLHEFVQTALQSGEATRQELFLSHVVLAAMGQGMTIHTVTFPDGRYLDIGAPETLARVHQSLRASGEW